MYGIYMAHIYIDISISQLKHCASWSECALHPPKSVPPPTSVPS